MAKDPVKVDPGHYSVELENRQVRVLRIRYGPREKSAMHGHPPSVGICLTDLTGRFMFPNGRAEERTMKAGQVFWAPAEEHLPENLADSPLEVLLVELKGQSAPKAVKTKPAAKATGKGGTKGQKSASKSKGKRR